MIPDERIKQWKVHPSIRGKFAFELYKHMAKNKDVYLLTGDLGYGMFDAHREDFPDRFINCGAAEFAMVGIGIGLALNGKIPFCYSITPFLLYRPFELLRTYVSHEEIPVRLCGSGRDDDYKHDGYSHDAQDVNWVLGALPKIQKLFPENDEDVERMVELMVLAKKPSFISLKK